MVIRIVIVVLSLGLSALAEPTETIPLHPVDDPGCDLQWIPHTPSGTGPWPSILLIHGGGYDGGGPNGTAGDLAQIGEDLKAQGFFVVSCAYRLAGGQNPVQGQTTNGTFQPIHQQTDDVKMFVRALFADSRCNGKLFVLGGSAGAAHAAYVTSTGNDCCDKPQRAVLMAGQYDYTYFNDAWNPTLRLLLVQYCGCLDTDTTLLQSGSPSYVSTLATANPLFLINSSADHNTPPVEGDLMMAALAAAGAKGYSRFITPGTDHVFTLWTRYNVKQMATAFMLAGLNMPPKVRIPRVMVGRRAL